MEILEFPSPTGYMLTSFGFSSQNGGIFHKFVLTDEIEREREREIIAYKHTSHPSNRKP